MKTLNEQNLKLQLNVRLIFSKLLLRKVAENKQKSKMFHVNFQTDLLVHGSGSAWRPPDEDLVLWIEIILYTGTGTFPYFLF